MRILIIANPIVGIRKEKKAVIDSIAAEQRNNGGTVDITFIMKPGSGRNYSSRAVLEGYDAVYAAGGDGTINEVASGLVGKNLPLGIIPLGTGNGLARGLGIPTDMDACRKVLRQRKIIAIDSGVFNSRAFFATAGIGFDAQIAHDFDKSRGTKTSIFQYFKFAVKNYFLRGTEDLTIMIDGEKITRRVFAMSVCNTSQYGGGAVIAPQADPTSGKLIAVIIPKIGVLRAIPATWRLFHGTATSVPGIEYYPFTSLRIKRSKPGIFHVDGEPFEGGKTLDVEVKPQSLQVIVP